ncbi:MAG: hypothetical protein QOG03_1483 [Actinomycetota bacterium]|nr:hypothetical protein [Actinomycetota bacterium]
MTTTSSIVTRLSLRRQPGVGRSRVGRLGLAGLVLLGLAAAIPARAGNERLQPVGHFPSTGPLYVDSPGRLLYQVSGDVGGTTIEIRDLDSLAVRAKVSTLGSIVPLVVSPLRGAGAHLNYSLAAVDATRHRLFYPFRDANTQAPQIAILDGQAGHFAGQAYAIPDPVVGGADFSVEGLDYDAGSDILYAVVVAPAMDVNTATSYAGAIFLEAISASDGRALWTMQVPGCSTLFGDKNASSPLGHFDGHLVFGCNASPTGISEVLILPAGASKPSAADVATYDAPVLPEKAVFDPASGRLFLLSENELLATFDSKHGAFVGLVLPGAGSSIGVDPGLGRVYLCTEKVSGGLLSVDAGSAAPVPPGAMVPSIDCPSAAHSLPIVADSQTGRVFLPIVGADGTTTTWTAMQDNLPSYKKPVPFDPDQGVADVAEARGVTQASYSSQGGAYGTRIDWVGGPIGVADNSSALAGGTLRSAYAEQAGLRLAEGGRAIRLARVSEAKMSSSGVQATAEVADRNNALETDLSTIRQHPIAQAVYSGMGTKSADQHPHWPYAPATCSTFGGPSDVGSANEPGLTSRGSASARCNFDDLSSTAKAEADRIDLDALGIAVGRSTASVTLQPDAARGATSLASASADNVNIADQVFIGQAVATVKAVAHGRPGSASTDYQRRFAGVRIVAPDHKSVIYQCRDFAECDPAKVVNAINQALGPRVRASLPSPEPTYLHGSQKGTTASLEEDRWRQIGEQLVFDKAADDLTMPAIELRLAANEFASSGVVLDLAGVTATATYRISLLPHGGAPVANSAEPGAISVPGGSAVGRPGIVVPGAPGAAPKTILRKVVERLAKGLRWVFGPRDFATVLAAWVLLLAPLYIGVRRRALIRSGLPGQ